MDYPPEQLIQMVYAIGESDGNCFLAARIYAQKYPNRSHPDVRSLQNLKERFEQTGSVSYEKKSRTPTVLNEENQLAISLAVVENPQPFINIVYRCSLRPVPLEQPPPVTTNANVNGEFINRGKFHPYHVQLHQELLENDFERRIHFCQWVHNVVAENEDFFKFVLFTDECMFHRNGFVNRHNFHYYDSQNPHIVQVNNHQHNWSINVCGGILHNYVIGPYIFQGSVTGEVFLNFLRNDFPRLIQHVPDFIKNRPTAWPPRSADLMPMDCFLWGVVKSDVYRVPATTREDMVEIIQQSFQRISPLVLSNVRRSLRRRAELCLTENGHHFEQLL
ncbi:hypothetical protein NQ315_015484 [Exocentrus adspersus]|uniref:DUF4817 domain-containing protein n=1 Tax=Exocentrus adspersus TaxID=1586481 RepID=A0AAV8VNI4_9CUCU|nr:hypothetical protein NQ315_015484 [Exocentrus adspersus]